MNEPLEILAQGTPNPNAAKFTLNRTIATQGTTYRLPAPARSASQSEAAGAQAGDVSAAMPAWTRELLAIPGITQVFVLNNFISVNKTADADWTVIGPQVEQILRGALSY